VEILRKVLIFVLFTCIAIPAGADEDRPRILVISESDSRLPYAQGVIEAIEDGLGPEVTDKGELFTEYLDLLRFGSPDERALKRDFLAARYGDTPLDAIVVLGQNALSFVIDNRNAIAPGVPVIFGALSQAGLDMALGSRAEPGISGVVNAFDIAATVRLALTVNPDAPEIVVLAGAAAFDRQSRETARAVLGDRFGNVPVRFMAESSASTLLAEVAALDPDTILLYLTLQRDSEGSRFLPRQFARLLAPAASAPVWTIYDTIIGTGVVGGQVEDVAASGKAIADMVKAAIRNEPLPAVQTVTGGPAVDWRAMQRHGLDTDLLPKGTRILFYEPSFWERYRLPIILVAGIIGAQAVTIAALVVQRRRLIRSQANLALERAQLAHVSRNLRLGQLSAALAHEINQPLAAIQANADAGSRLAARTPPDQAEIVTIFGDIAADVSRAATIIANLRRLIVKDELTFSEVDLNDIVTATVALARNELASRGAQVRLTLASERLIVRGNGPQLQQIVLNLAFNAAEAMADLPEAARIVRVSTACLPDGRRILAVADAGPGLSPEMREAVFRPFVTTKPTGLGVGLAICRNIAEAHGGTLAFTEPDPGGGARILLTLPPPVAAT
jgi:signal transduction histidine kinase